jgi:hypothetical protein
VNAPAIISADNLPTLIDRARSALDGARTSAEILEARDFARVAYDATKSAGRMARAKQAHDDVIGAVYRAQADALLIEARAKMRLADEYDAAQERKEVVGAHDGARKRVGDDNAIATAADLGLRRDEIHEARKLRDAEQAEPGLAQRALNAMIERGDEPTRAALQRSVLAAVADARKPADRRNPHFVPDGFRDKLLTFIDHCEQLAATGNLEAIAEYDDPRFASTAVRRDRCAQAALETLTRYMEIRNAQSCSG